MATKVRYLDRRLLKNVLRHTETHNRLQEEEEMWDKKKDRRSDRPKKRSRGPVRYGQMYSDSPQDLMGGSSRDKWNQRRLNRGGRQGMGREVERWSHNGFMELYPEESINRSSMDESSDEGGIGQSNKRKKHSKSTH
eukprot:XP_001177346.2 PREDICTED: uncharacterized protein C11orf57 [Strongylocentrotus purpuratus]